MKIVDEEILRAGSHFLGSGGGLDFEISKLMLRDQMKVRSSVVITLDSLKSDDCIVVISYMGCPTIEAEKNFNISHTRKLIEKIEYISQRKINAFAMWGVAGGGAFLPIFMSSYFEIPIIDADLTGRCFPALQMLSTNMVDIAPLKFFISNLMGNFFEIECDNFFALERHARQITVSSGGACLIAPQILTGEEAKRGLIPGSLTKALTIGQIIQDTRHLECEEACKAIVDYTKGTFWGMGGIMSIDGYLSNLPRPFNRRIVMKDWRAGKVWEVLMANEYDVLIENGKVVAEVPDIISLCDMETREPLTIRQLHDNRNIAIMTSPAPDIWYTERGLALVRTKEHMQGRNALCSLGSSVHESAAELGKIAMHG